MNSYSEPLKLFKNKWKNTGRDVIVRHYHPHTTNDNFILDHYLKYPSIKNN